MPKAKNKQALMQELSEKQLAELRAIDERLNGVVADRQVKDTADAAPMQFETKVGTLTFRYETVRCGKQNCSRCPHGPYWYAYWKENGRTRSRYIGRSLPAVARSSYEGKRQARLEKRA